MWPEGRTEGAEVREERDVAEAAKEVVSSGDHEEEKEEDSTPDSREDKEVVWSGEMEKMLKVSLLSEKVEIIKTPEVEAEASEEIEEAETEVSEIEVIEAKEEAAEAAREELTDKMKKTWLLKLQLATPKSELWAAYYKTDQWFPKQDGLKWLPDFEVLRLDWLFILKC